MKVIKPFKGNVSAAVTAHLAVPEGDHTIGVKLLEGSGLRLALRVSAVDTLDNALALGPEEDLAPEKEKVTTAEAPPPPPPPVEPADETPPPDAEAAGAEARAESLGIVEGEAATKAAAESEPAAARRSAPPRHELATSSRLMLARPRLTMSWRAASSRCASRT